MAPTSSPYPFKATEAKWQKIWKQNHTDKTPELSNDQKGQKDQKSCCAQSTSRTKNILNNMYILEMLPYPSGKIHMGHIRNYTIGDVIARFKKAQGVKVLHPMGWDAFGMPAENAAAKNHSHPKTWTYENIKAMKQVLISMGYSYDWDREFATCDTEYYGLEQEIFLSLYNHDLVYRKESFINWDPVDQTVLANEQVIDGRGWRSGALVVKKKIPHWCIKITQYADRLLEDLPALQETNDHTGWPDKVLTMQRNWIGKSEGLETTFPFVPSQRLSDSGYSEKGLVIFTTRPETLFGASFCAIAPDHPLTKVLCKIDPKVEAFAQECLRAPVSESAQSLSEKQGLDTGLFVTNPLVPSQKLPVFIASFVLSEYGTGAIFACPAHDQRDFEFAVKYNLPINKVIQSPEDQNQETLPYIEPLGTMIHSDFLNGMEVLEARKAVLDHAERTGIGFRKTTYRLRDWTVSRQRYWGCPIPMIHCPTCGIVPVPKEQLPVLLPDDVTFDQPGNPLDRHPTWKHVKCPKCGQDAQRDTDTLDTFFESSWYFLRYCCPHDPRPINPKEVNEWMPVDIYIGGIEHAVLHLLYARFFTMALSDMGYFNDNEESSDCPHHNQHAELYEPFKALFTQGMVCHDSYQAKDGSWIYPSEVERKSDGSYYLLKTGEPVTVVRAEKMSKSKNNVITPESMADAYGVDALRLFIMSDTPYDKDFYWSNDALEGTWRYLNKLWRMSHQMKPFNLSENLLERALSRSVDDTQASSLLKITHSYFSKITEAINRFAFHKAIALHRELTRALEETPLDSCSTQDQAEIIFIWIASLFPFTPHFALEAFEQLFHPKDIVDQLSWPKLRDNLIHEESVTIAVQVCGKLRATFEAPVGSSQEFLEAESLKLENVQKFVNGKEIKKIFIVPDKIVNIVTA